MITILVGHRGVGKSSLLERIKKYLPQSLCLCLDTEIEKRFGPIQQIFSIHGEPFFREIEKKVFNEIYKTASTEEMSYLAVGAGFEGEIPEECHVIWIQRAVDLSQARFLDRPSLNKNEAQLTMPRARFKEREERYRSWANEEYLMPEGELSPFFEEEQFFKKTISSVRGSLTLLAPDFKKPHFKPWLQNRLKWSVSFFELRDDLLSTTEIQQALDLIPSQNLLFSFRDKNKIDSSLLSAQNCLHIDWPIEFGKVPLELAQRAIISLHGEHSSFQDDLKQVQGFTGAVKWSPVIETLQELELAHKWVTGDSKRSLLPRSSSGKWSWYRLLQKNKQNLNFFREGEGSALDQPSLVQWMQRDPRAKIFAAVLGSPVVHSWTPQFHRDFFKEKKCDVFAIDVVEEELNNGGLEFLQSLGFQYFAVTSPLKNWAGQLLGPSEPINTLAWNSSEKSWYGTSTDKAGFLYLAQQAEILFTRGKNTVIWGGGGVLPSLQEVLPQAQLYSAQNGRPRPHNSMVENPTTLIWAGGETTQLILSCHPHWKPERVVDLNYRTDSVGRDYAFATGARYYSGRDMFVAQAEEQQKFWRRYE